MRISLFVTCANDTVAPETGIATVRLLERLGHEVVFHEAQTCCGQMHFNTGYQADALALARRFVRVFGDDELVVTPSASCTAWSGTSTRTSPSSTATRRWRATSRHWRRGCSS